VSGTPRGGRVRPSELAGVHQLPDTRSVVVIRSTVGFQALDRRKARFASVLVLSLASIGAASIACSSSSSTRNIGADASGGGTTGGVGGDSSADVGQSGASGAAGGASGGSGGDGGASGGVGGASLDGSTDAAVDAVSEGCVSPKPIAAFDAGQPGTRGQACNSNNVMGVADSVFAGLDCRVGALDIEYIDGQPVCGCLGVDFGAAVDLDPLFIRMRSTPNACGTPCGGASCNSGHDLLVFEGGPGGYSYLQTIEHVAAVPGDYPIASLGGPARYIVVCRFAYSPDRDDIEIDSIYSEACQ